MKEYHLPKGTKLDGKYRICEVIGEGGFGITYSAVNERLSMKVAIKELYCKMYLTRDVKESNVVRVNYTESEFDFDKTKKKFIREAKILSQFRETPGIVHLLDYFEENGTAYIVMNYVEGITLDAYIKQHGTLSWEHTLELIQPVLKSLIQLHDQGIVHRDISSNNIMISEDGSTCLIDFGSTKDVYGSKTNTTVVYSKSGYTPLEQLSDTGHVGPWSDIYSIMVVCYECMTGILPPNVLQRTVLDEYKSLKELKKKAPKMLDDILKKGLQIDYTKRYQNVEMVLSDIEKIFGEKHNKVKKIKMIRNIACVAGLFLCLLGGIWGYHNRERLMFWGIETEEFCIYPKEDIKPDEFQSDCEFLEERLKVFVGEEPYVFSINDDFVRCVVPKECFEERNVSGTDTKTEIQYIIDDFLICKGSFGLQPENASVASLEDIHRIQKSSVESVRLDGDRLSFRLKNSMPQELKNFVESEENVQFTFVTPNIGLGYLAEKVDNYSYCVTLDLPQRYQELLSLIYRQEELTYKYGCSVEINADWENTDNPYYVGKNQSDISKMSSDCITVKYCTISDMTAGKYMDSLIDIKNRLDILDIPYAIGFDKEDENSIVVRVNKEDYSKDLFSFLTTGRVEIEVEDEWFRRFSDGYSAETKLSCDGNGVLLEIAEDDVSLYQSYYNRLMQDNLRKFYFTVNKYPLFSGEMSGKEWDGKISFTNINVIDGKINEKNRVFIDLLNYILSEDEAESELSQYTLSIVQYSDAGHKVLIPDEEMENNIIIDKSEYNEIVTSIQQLDYSFDVSVRFPWENTAGVVSCYLSGDYYNDIEEKVVVTESMIRDIVDAACAEEGMLYDSIYIEIPEKENKYNCAARIAMHRATEEDESAYSVNIIIFDDEYQWMMDLTERMKKNERFKNVFIECFDN